MKVQDVRVQSKKHGIDQNFPNVNCPETAEDFVAIGGTATKWDALAASAWETQFKNQNRANLVMEKVGKVPGLRSIMEKIKASGKSVEEILEILETLA